ncbi:MAG: hypothetical protein ABF461_04310 [Zymomonas mobilis subsp. pomaceae]|uniref:Uncharacterized protein n=1 Tax=Zymomonas mobilis subsp. pomaceae (strain ATCC 29192 / DSM 22645 / JCM 10191 / CCUG 17912 / NBRC 13757 / NCIMB 11200 / NRRL B-4491 / Barker I) TaxID=579138 RepID=F8ESE1_ZYMMT|nr:hypothetical protein [Zymomonas mobilis]AEI37716.1 hypothetical protein Zymop_0815 [Zymomonas mobilis subsp. pomaceae ATCC 29192]MDX5949083.1 hypothetical protein [Zymomonas mobilis subsp. pomaceae]GEB88888.1 hypothetical protein ZMO02_05250 [Zymomonas mobilis subsp. pomaceae]
MVSQRFILGAYEPDQPPHLTDCLINVSNAYPSANGYRPVGSFCSFAPALPTAFMGASAFLGSDGSTLLLAGTKDSLYRYVSGNWQAILTGLPAYGLWHFTQFGDFVIAVNGSATRKVNILTGEASAISDAPTAEIVATIRDFVVYGRASAQKNLLQWSGFNNEDSNVIGDDQAGYQPMLTGGDIMGIIGGEYGVIIQRSRIVRMTYTGDAYIWQFDEISANVGAIAAGSIAQAGRQAFFLSDRGFMMTDGVSVTPIGNERVDRSFFESCPRNNLSEITAAIDPRRHMVAWLIPGHPSMVLIYNWAIDRWSRLDLAAISLFSGFTANTTLEDLNKLYPHGLDTIPYSLDDPRFSGGDPLFIFVGPQNDFGVLTGCNLPACFETGFFSAEEGYHSRIRSARLLSDITEEATLTIKMRARLGDPTTGQVKTIVMPSGRIPLRVNSRYCAAVLETKKGANWSFIQGFDWEIIAGEGR